MFPEGFQNALEQLLKVLSASDNSYSLTIYRYEGEKDYKAEVRMTYQDKPTVVK